MAVRTAPAMTPRTGFVKVRNICWKDGSFLSAETAPVMVSIPYISVAKPSSISPVSFRLLFLDTIKKMIPNSARIGVNDDGFNSLTKTLLLSIPARLKIHAVTVVPIFAPIMTLMDCFRVINPELTKPTTMTVVADELCMIAVTPSPVKRPVNRLVVIRPRSAFNLLPARRSNACPISVIPNRNRLKPPIRFNTSNKSIIYSPFSFSQLQNRESTSNPLSCFCKKDVRRSHKKAETTGSLQKTDLLYHIPSSGSFGIDTINSEPSPGLLSSLIVPL